MYILVYFVSKSSECKGKQRAKFVRNSSETTMATKEQVCIFFSLVDGKFKSVPFSQQKYLNFYIQVHFLAKICQPENTSPKGYIH